MRLKQSRSEKQFFFEPIKKKTDSPLTRKQNINVSVWKLRLIWSPAAHDQMSEQIKYNERPSSKIRAYSK